MPYVSHEVRDILDDLIKSGEHYDIIGDNILNAGELNYVITRLVDGFLSTRKETNYQAINEVIGVLECAKLELYRRIAAPYEDTKIKENGDVYTVLPNNDTGEK